MQNLQNIKERITRLIRPDGDASEKKSRILKITAGLLVLILLIYFLAENIAISRLHYDARGNEVPEIDPSYAAGLGIYFPDREPTHDSKVINILFLGTDFRFTEGDHGRADSNILCSLDLRRGEIRLVSFERGIGVPVPGRGSDLLTHAYQWGGPELSQAVISQMFCVDISGYAQVDFDTFADVIDAIGGVDVELTELEAQALNGAIPTTVWSWAEVHEGQNHLGGHDTLQYCRLRSIDSDWNRQRRQRAVLEQVQQQLSRKTRLQQLKIVNDVLPMVHTNLDKHTVKTLVRHMPKLLHGSVSQLQVPDKNGSNGSIRCIPDYESKKIANFLYDAGFEISSPY